MYYIVGLGNPGVGYEHSRHNVGFTVLEDFVKAYDFSSFYNSRSLQCFVSEGVIDGKEVTILLPQTYMNHSGVAVRKALADSDRTKLMVVYDDIDIPVGELKVSFGRGAGGHNGVASIIEKLNTQDFARLRIGIAQKSIWTGKLKRPKGEALADFVLGSFTKSEQKVLSEVLQRSHKVLTTFVTDGIEKTMNTYN